MHQRLGHPGRNTTFKSDDILGEKMRDAITGAVDSVGVPANVSGWHYRSAINFELPEETLRPKINTLFIQEMA